MKALIVLAFLFSQAAWGKAELNVGSAATEQFTFKEVDGDPTKLLFLKPGASTGETVDLRYSLSDLKKFTVTLTKGNKTVNVELLLVVTVSGARNQLVQVFSPVHNGDFIVGNNINPRCSLTNFGDFYWDSDQEFKSKLSLVESGDHVTLNISLKTQENGPRAFTECLKFRTASK